MMMTGTLFMQRAHGRLRTYEYELATRRGGGQADVYRARSADGDVVALKIAKSTESNPALVKERRVLEHIHAQAPDAVAWIVRVIDHGQLEDSRCFVVLPWYEHTLDSWLQHHAPGLSWRLAAAEQAAAAVARLHGCSGEEDHVLLHRDIKPTNFLVEQGEDGLVVVLADLGGARQGRLGVSHRNTGLHTPLYAAPEQQLPLRRSPDPSVDVHGLAATVYRCLAGQPPMSVRARQSLALETFYELLQLQTLDDRRSRREQARLEQLERESVGSFFDLEDAAAMLPADTRRLRNALEESLDEGPGERSERLLSILLPPLEAGLAPDPALREREATTLRDALRSGWSLLRDDTSMSVVGAPSTEPPSSPSHPVEPRPAPGRVRRKRASWLLWGTAVLAASGAAGLLYARWGGGGEPGEQIPASSAAANEVSESEPHVALDPAEPVETPSPPAESAELETVERPAFVQEPQTLAAEPAPGLPPGSSLQEPTSPAPSVTQASQEVPGGDESAAESVPEPPVNQAEPVRVRVQHERTASISVYLSLRHLLSAPGDLSLESGEHPIEVRARGFKPCRSIVDSRHSPAGWELTLHPVEGGGPLQRSLVAPGTTPRLVCGEDGLLVLR